MNKDSRPRPQYNLIPLLSSASSAAYSTLAKEQTKMSLQCRRKSTTKPTSPTKARWMTAATLAFSASCVASFSSTLQPHHRHHAIHTSQRYVVTDPDTLLREATFNNAKWDQDLSEIETMYNLPSSDSSEEFQKFDPPPSTDSLLPKRTPIHQHQQRTAHMITEEEIMNQSCSEKPVFKRVAMQRQLHRPTERSLDTTSISKSSTMPGFGAMTFRERAFEDGIFLAESKSGKNLRKAHYSPSAKLKRKQTNGESMYKTSPSVPDSLVHFANQIHKVCCCCSCCCLFLFWFPICALGNDVFSISLTKPHPLSFITGGQDYTLGRM